MAGSGECGSRSQTTVIRRMRAADVPALSSILNESPNASRWSDDSLRSAAQSGTSWVAEQEGRVVAFLLGRAITDEFEILNLAVTQHVRRCGIATGLLETMIEWSKGDGIQRIYLEVRASNEAAKTLYARHGFGQCGTRARYYQYPQEDAIVLVRESDAAPKL